MAASNLGPGADHLLESQVPDLLPGQVDGQVLPDLLPVDALYGDVSLHEDLSNDLGGRDGQEVGVGGLHVHAAHNQLLDVSFVHLVLHAGNHLFSAPALSALVLVSGQLVEDEGDEVGGLAVGGQGGAADRSTGGGQARLGLLVVLMAELEAGWGEGLVGHGSLHPPAIVPGSTNTKDTTELV